MTLLEIRLLTVKEYHTMIKSGIFDEDERVELLGGQIVKMAAKGTGHSAAVNRTVDILRNSLAGLVSVRPQDPIQLNDLSEPEPDIAVVMPNQLYYEDCHPTPSEIYLIIEVADTSLNRDTEFKAGIYAQSGITDYWVLDVNKRQLYVFREPSQDSYQSQVILSENETISPLAFPNCTIIVREMLRPPIAF